MVVGVVITVAFFSCFVFITWETYFSTRGEQDQRGRNEFRDRFSKVPNIPTFSERHNHSGKLAEQTEYEHSEAVSNVPEQLDACSICLEVYQRDTKIDVLGCGHIFHPQCIAKWIERNPLCPMCRQHSGRHCAAERAVSRNHVHQRTRPAPAVVTSPVVEPLNLDECLYLTAVLTPDLSFGVRVATTRNGLLVTYIEPNQLGDQQGVCIGDYLIKQDNAPVPVGIADGAFASQLRALGRPVILGFARPSTPSLIASTAQLQAVQGAEENDAHRERERAQQ
jgi:hypothetical protein